MVGIFGYKKVYIDLLNKIKDITDNKDGDNKAHRLLIEACLAKKSSEDKSKGKHDSYKLLKALKELVDAGYLQTYRSNYALTVKGDLFLENHNLWKVLPWSTKINNYIDISWSKIISLLAIIISITTLIIKR